MFPLDHIADVGGQSEQIGLP